MKQIFVTAAKWSWFGLLTLLAFGYMAAGLSKKDDSPQRFRDAARPTTLDGTTLDGTEADGTRLDDAALMASMGNAKGASDPGLMSGESLESPGQSVAEIVAAVNAARDTELNALGLQRADAVDWQSASRRLSLALVGSGVSLQEIRQLESYPAQQRSAVHLGNLLIDPRFHDYWAERWTRFLVGADEGPFIVYRRRRFRHWLSDELAANRPYDQIVTKLITAEGLWTDRPEVNFLTVTFDSNDGNPDPIRLAARTSRAFLGLRIDCLQCHNDFLGNVNLGDAGSMREGRQTDFHQLAAFFSSAKTNGLQGVRTGPSDYKYKYLDASEEVDVQPAVPYAAELLPSEGDARTRLAEWVTHPDNRQFSRAAVVRLWALMFGLSPTEAIDNLPLDEALPPMLEPIIDDFQRHRDIRRTIEIIARSDAFHASSRAAFEITPDHEQHHAVFPMTRLRAEQVAGSIVQASKLKSINRDSSLIVQLIRFGSINDFLERYGDLGENEFSKDGITIPQRLLMINGNMLQEAGKSDPILSAVGHINLFAQDDRQAVETTYLCLLNRYPNVEESEHFVDSLRQCDDRGQAIEDLFWTLANSTEFTWNH